MRIRLTKLLRKLLAKKNLADFLALFLVGTILSCDLSFVPTPLLHYILYKDVASGVNIVLILGLAAFIMLSVFYGAKRLFSLTRKRAFKILFVGASVFSFTSGLWTFFCYPEILASGGYGWLTGGVEWHIGVGVALSSLAFFVAVILWDILLGSLFAALQSLLT